jgi:tetratricopeptide (TPR) repeat protein
VNRQQRRAEARYGKSSNPVPGGSAPPLKLFDLALRHHQAGDLTEAERCYHQILLINPSNAPTLHMLGLIAHARGHAEIAIELIRKAITSNNRVPEFHHNLGNILRDNGRLEEAAFAYQKALTIKADSVDTLYNLGNLSQELRRPHDAIAYLEQAALLQPQSVEILNNLGATLHDHGKLDDAILCYQRALLLQPASIETLANYGAALCDKGALDLASEQYERALALGPSRVETLNGFGIVLREQGNTDTAIAQFRHALSLDPARGETHNNLAIALEQAGDLTAATAHYRQAVSLSPQQPEIHNNLGNALEHQGLLDEATACYEQALALKPDYAEAHYNRSLLRLLLRDYVRGWAEYEWRWRCKANPGRPHTPSPRWSGEPLAGKTILILTEQGFGDTLQFLRYVPMLAGRGARVMLTVPRPLIRLTRELTGAITVLTEGDSPTDIDFHCPLLSLPHLFGTTLETIPASVPYLAPPGTASAVWERRLPVSADLRIGLVWSGNPNSRINARRSIEFSALEPLWEIPGTSWYSLQVGSPRDDITLAGQAITDLSPFLTDFAETAAAICRLDLIISVETAVAHLAGALGRPVWVPLTVVPAWRWLLDRADSPWYPTMRLYRQTIAGDWAAVISALAEGLARMAREKPAGE